MKRPQPKEPFRRVIRLRSVGRGCELSKREGAGEVRRKEASFASIVRRLVIGK